MQNKASNEERAVFRDLTVSAKHTQSSRDSSTISIPDNSTPWKPISGIKTDSPTALPVETAFLVETALPVETDIAFTPDTESIQLSNNRSVMPTDAQALTVLQDLISGDFQAKNTHSTQRKREDGKDEAFQLILKIHNQLQQVQWDLQRLHSLHKYKN